MQIPRSNKNFEPCPEYTGPAVCVDVTPLKKVTTQWGDQEKFRLAFEIGLARKDGTPWCVWSTGFTPSWHEKAAFRKFIKAWFGRDLTEEEMDKFDTEELVGRPAFLVVIHNSKDDQVYANIASCTAHRSGEPLAPSGKFVRAKDRDKEKEKDSTYRRTEAPATPTASDWMSTKVHVGRYVGSELRELTGEAIGNLVAKWLPTAKTNPKSTADDRRLMAALEAYQEMAKNQAQQPEPDEVPF